MEYFNSNKLFLLTIPLCLIIIAVRPKTLFAPTDAAFQALPSGFLEALFANKAEMGKLINKHTLSGTWYSNGLVSGPLPLFSGDTVNVVASSRKWPYPLLISTRNVLIIFILTELGGIRVGNANIIGVDLTETEGVVHVIDAVILI